MLLADLKSMAAGLGIAGAGSMKKAVLVEAIKSSQSAPATPTTKSVTKPNAKTPVEEPAAKPAEKPAEEPAAEPVVKPVVRRTQRTARTVVVQAPTQAPTQAPAQASSETPTEAATETPAPEPAPDRQPRERRAREKQAPATDVQDQGAQDKQSQDRSEQRRQGQDRQDQDRSEQRRQGQDRSEQRRQGQDKQAQDKQDSDKQGQKQAQQTQGKQSRQGGQGNQGQQQGNQGQQQGQQAYDKQDQQSYQFQNDDDDDGEGGSRRNRRRRGRDRTTVRAGTRNEPDTTILEDDVLVPAAGILDVLDNCAFVRTSGYLPGPEDVYLSLSMVRKYNLRRGDAVVGQVRQPREGERREKFNPMVRIDSINGTEAEGAKDRVDFADAVPVHPHQRLRLSTDEFNLTGRVIDVAAPVGKGQRGLILAPPRTGATSLLQSIATSVTTNNPECHVMVVLIDTRPEEVTDFQRAVKGEVVASTFDRQPADHTLVAELAIERAKRLVELGHDVVVLLDSLTRLGRAYNLAAPPNGRVLGGLVDSSAVHPTKEFFGAARKIEDGGSLTILATVTVGTGSATDEFFLEELAGTANLELRLSVDRAAAGIVPAVDVVASGTRHEELLLAPAEGAVVGNLRKQLAAADSPQALNKLVGSRMSAD